MLEFFLPPFYFFDYYVFMKKNCRERVDENDGSINANRFSHKYIFYPIPHSPITHSKKTFPFLLLLCVSFTNEIEKLCLITGIYIRHCSSFFLPHPPLRSPLRRAFFSYKSFFAFPPPRPGKKKNDEGIVLHKHSAYSEMLVYLCFELQNYRNSESIII